MSDQSNLEHSRLRFANDIPILRAIVPGVPRYYVGSVLENRLGSQVFRLLSKHLLWRLRRHALGVDVARYAQRLNDDGILVIENFLPPLAFDAVRNEYEKVMTASALTPYKGVENGVLHRTQVPLNGNTEKLPHIREHFQNNKFLHSLASFVIRRSAEKNPDVFLDLYKAVGGKGVDNDIENVLHADLHMPTVKMFYYLERVNAENGAFIYAKGSHRLSVARLAHEYDLSVRQAKLKAGAFVPDRLLAQRADEVRNLIDPKHHHRMRLAESGVHVESNTLLVTNNMGFHRRGEFEVGRERKALLINYRNSDRKLF